MKLKNLKCSKSNKRGYLVAAALSLCLLISFGLVRVSAQLKVQKRITSVWTATGAEGSRVTVASVLQLNDYEAYTRGNRFYVKIPAADLPSTTGSLLGRGFDDVQIQRAGDGIIISFRLQPGTTARVEQKVNRLEIVFSIPMRSQSARAITERSELANRTRARRIQDTSGPMPPRTVGENSKVRKPASPRERHVTTIRGANKTKHDGETVRNSESTPVGNTGSAGERNRQKPAREKSGAPDSNSGASTASSKQPSSSQGSTSSVTSSGSKRPSGNEGMPPASPLPSANPVDSPTPNASATLLASASPYSTPVPVASPTTQQATSSASPNPVSSNDQRSDWPSRIHYYKVWAQLNWLPLLIGGLVFLALLVLLFVGRRSKLQSRDAAEREEKPFEKTTAAAAGAEAARPAKAIPPPAATTPARAAVDHKAEVSPKNTTSSSAAGASAPADEDQEREVFEL